MPLNRHGIPPCGTMAATGATSLGGFDSRPSRCVAPNEDDEN